MSLLDELDAKAFEQEVTRLKSSKLHPMHLKTINILSQRMFDEPAAHTGCSIPVFIASEISDRRVVIKNLERWSQTKGLSLDGVSRIDVIARRRELEYLGRYNLFFSGIILTWPSDRARGLHLWLRRLDAEFTFYHEVGHHVSGHVEGGQVAVQEREADEYARLMMRSSRPVFVFFGKLLLWPFKPLLKKVTKRFDRAEGEPI